MPPNFDIPHIYTVRRDIHGFADGIECDGWTVLHLTAGSVLNRENAEAIVALLNQAVPQKESTQ